MRYRWLLLLSLLLPVMPGVAGEATLDLDAYRGKVVYLDFWASWCVPCRRSFPWLNEMRNKYGDDGFSVVAVNVDAERELAAGFLRETPATFDIIYDPAGEIAAQWELIGMPSSFIIDRDGKVASRHVGFRSDSLEKYEAEIRRLLGKEVQ